MINPKLRLDHIAVAVKDIDAAVAAFSEKLGLPCEKVEHVEAQKATVAFFSIGDAHLELVAPSDPTSTVARSIEKRGEGLHHLCFEVPSLDAAIAESTAKGAELAGQPSAGAGGSRVAFLHPRSMNGVLVELVEKPGGGGHG
jgi:methylmalonyl-CoA/ethylmalonyl-CoA epimerase